jgi:hypothetical protein
MDCPHCLTAFFDKRDMTELGEDSDSKWTLINRQCPTCGKFIVSLFQRYGRYNVGSGNRYHYSKEFYCYPKVSSRAPLPPEVPDEFAIDYQEACLTLTDSPKASAAISRRCLQHILREAAKVRRGNLADEIQQILDEGKMPSHLLESLDAIRNIGNFAAHPTKSETTGEVIDVEPGEAEWNLDVLESLFDYYFVQPELLKLKREALNAKLKEAGKPEMK